MIDQLKEAEVIKEKYCKQEDLKEELEGFATQELAKVKHMVGCESNREGEHLKINKKKSNRTISDGRMLLFICCCFTSMVNICGHVRTVI